MPGNDLDAPLGYAPDPDALRATPLREIPWGGLALSGMGLIAVSLVAFVMVTDETAQPSRALAALEPIGAKRISVPDLAPSPARNDDATSTIGRTVRMPAAPRAEDAARIVGRNAVDGPEAIVGRAPDDARTGLAPAPDPRLTGPGPHGALPRIGRDGARPSDVYARPVTPGSRLASGLPRIAIVMTGLGPSAALSAHAVQNLPAAVTFAFAPEGDNLLSQAEQARAAGHELMLQSPMEGFGESQPGGARTLAAAAPRDKNLDALHWQMSRFPGYIGVTNSLGARFMSTAQAFAPVMQDIAERGLVFLDNGGSPQSLAASLGAAAGAPFARADVVLDGAAEGEAFDASLRKLESVARERGSAIGVVDAQPQSVDRINRFAQGLEARGVVLAPVSALIQAPARTSAR